MARTVGVVFGLSFLFNIIASLHFLIHYSSSIHLGFEVKRGCNFHTNTYNKEKKRY